MKKILSALLILSALCVAAPAGQLLVQLNDTGTNACATGPLGATNTYAITGDTTQYTNGVPFTQNTTGPATMLSFLNSDDAYFSFTMQYKNASTNTETVTARLAGSVDSTHWTNAVTSLAVVLPALSTNIITGVFKVTDAFPLMSLRSIEVPATTGDSISTTNIGFKALGK